MWTVEVINDGTTERLERFDLFEDVTNFLEKLFVTTTTFTRIEISKE